jgi:hypothetical protein
MIAAPRARRYDRVMRFAVVACLAALAACYPDDDRRKVSSGGPGGAGQPGGSFSPPDAFSFVDGPPTVILGQVCQTSDLHMAVVCATPGAGLTVTDLESGITTTTDVIGNFALPSSGATTATLAVENGGNTAITPTVATVVNTGRTVIVPVVQTTTLTNLETQLGSPIGTGQGSLLLFVQNPSGVGQPGFFATPPPGFLNNVFFDDTTVIGWGANGVTGNLGGVLMMGVSEGSFAIQLSNQTAGVQVAANVRFLPGHVTFGIVPVTP